LLPPWPEGKAGQNAVLARSKADIEKAEALKPDDPRVILGLAAEWMRLGEFERAEAALKLLDTMLVPVSDSEGKVIAFRLGDDKAFLAYDIVDPVDLVVARFRVAFPIVAYRRVAEEGVALADRTLGVLKQQHHRMAVLPAAVELYVAGGKTAAARACVDEYLKAADMQQVPEPREKVAWLKALVAQAEGDHMGAIAAMEPVASAGLRDLRAWRVLAHAYGRTGQPQPAARALDECRRLGAQDPQTMLWLVREYRSQGRMDKALEVATSAVQLSPDSLPAAVLRIETAALAAPEKPDAKGRADLDRLAADLASLRKKHGDLPSIRIAQAALAVKQGRPEEAQKELQETIRSAPEAEALTARLRLAQVLLGQQRTDDAIRICREATEKHKSQPAPWLALAEALASSKKYDEAQAALETGLKAVESREDKETLRLQLESLSITNGSPQFRVERANALAKEENADARIVLLLLQFPEILADEAVAQAMVDKIRQIQGEASVLWRLYQVELWLSQDRWRDKQKQITDSLNRCLAADPQWSAPARLLGLMQERLGDGDGAEATYRRALVANPEAVEMADRLMVLLERRGRFADAKEVLDQVDKGTGVLGGHRWLVAYGEGNVTQAIELLKLRVTHDPKDAQSRIDLARVMYAEKQDVGLALKYLDEAAAIAPDSMMPLIVRLTILDKEGRRDEARRQLDAEVTKRNSFAAYLIRADYLAAIGEAALAEKDYIHLTAIGTSGEGHVRLARFYADSGNWDKAITTLEEGIKGFPANLVLLDRLMRALYSRNAGDDRENASKILAALEKARPDDPGILGVRALVLLREGKAESTLKAQKLLERVVQLAPTRADAYMVLINLALNYRGDAAGASSLAAKAMEANPGSKELVLAKAEAERRLGNLVMARDLVRTILKQNRDDADAMNTLVSLAGDPPEPKAIEEALALAREAAGRKPSDEQLQLVSARALAIGGQADAAITRLEAFRQSEAGRSSVSVLLVLADLYRRADRPTECGERIEQAAKLVPDHPGVAEQRLLRLTAAKQLDAVVGLASSLATQKNVSARIFVMAGQVLGAPGAQAYHKEAEKCYNEAIRRDASNIEALRGLASLAYEQGNIDDALQHYAKVLEVHPYNTQALNDMAWIMSEGRKDYKTALELADRGVTLAPNDDHLRDTRGVILMRLGRFQDARKDFEKFAELVASDKPRRAKALLQLSRACAKMKDTAQVQRCLDEAMKIDQQKPVFTAEERAEINRLIQGSNGKG
jgi:tetratricopeptide (TPR) repeat protein